jgi:hypothetical protein
MTNRFALITFGKGNPVWKFSTRRLIQEARSSKFFSIALDMSNCLDQTLESNQKKFLKENKKGYGFWFWKPLIILEALKKNPDIDVIVYMDAGCEINHTPESILTFNKYKSELLTYDAIVFGTGVKENNWTKNEVFRALKTNVVDQGTEQISTTVIIMKRDFAFRFCEKWRYAMKASNYSLITDSISDESTDFIDHRHDQSVFSLLIKLEPRILIKPYNEANFEPNWNLGKNFPFWMRRNRTSRKADSRKILDLAIRSFQKLVGRIYRLSQL